MRLTPPSGATAKRAYPARALFDPRLEADMRVIMFQDKFAPKVLDGSKCQTIRKAARCKAGDTLSLRRWTGKPYRSKQEILREAIVEKVLPCVIADGWIDVDGRLYTGVDADSFAMRDGFAGATELWDWFAATYGEPIAGEVIMWSNPTGLGTTHKAEGANHDQ